MKLAWLEHAWNFYERRDFTNMNTVDTISQFILPIFHNTVKYTFFLTFSC